MTFNAIVWKMMKANYKRYFMYFSCNTFAVLLLFLFLSIYFNDEIEQMKQSDSFDTVLAPPTVALIFFMWFFVQKTHQLFIKERKSEFGVFMAIGMSPKNIERLVMIESSFVSIFALLFGLIGGVILAKAFFLLLSTFTMINGAFFHISFKMVAVTALIYSLIFIITVLISVVQMRQQSLVDSISSKRVMDEVNIKNPNFGYGGIALIIISIFGLYLTYLSQDDLLFLWALLTFLGLYLFLSNALYLFTSLIKNSPKIYYQSILLFSSLAQKQKKLTSLFTLTSIMIMITTLYCTITIYIAKDEYNWILSSNPTDISYLQYEQYNTISNDELHRLFENEDSEITEITTIPYFEIIEENYYGEDYYNIISVATFNEFLGEDYRLAEDEFYLYINRDLEHVADEQLDVATFQLGPYELKNKYKETEKLFTTIGQTTTFIVINQQLWDRFIEEKDTKVIVQHHIQVNDWKKSLPVVHALQNYFHEHNPKIEQSDESLFSVSSKVESYQNSKTQNAVLFYLMSYLCIILFLGAFTLLYLNLMSDIELEKLKFEKLYKIGVTKKEMKEHFTSETFIMFFLPTFVGIVVAFLYLLGMSQDVGGLFNNLTVLGYFTLMSGIYLFIQFSFFFYAKSKLFKKVWYSISNH